MGVEGAFDGAHDFDALTQFLFEGVFDKKLAELAHFLQFGGIAWLNKEDDVEIAVADMAKERGGDCGLF